MEPTTMLALGKISLALIVGIGGLGSSLGVLAAGSAAAGAWAKEGKEGKNLSASFNGIVGMPISQTIYCLLMYIMMRSYASESANGPVLFGIALGVGFCQFISAYAQGKIGGAGIRCLSENGGKGFGNIVMAMGIAESIALFAMLVGILILNSEVMVKAVTAATAATQAVG